jgi:hypothetical protein
LYKASEANKAKAEDALFQFGDDDSDIEAAHNTRDIYIDIDIQSDTHNSSKSVSSTTKDIDFTANSDDSYREVDDDAAASVSLFEAAEDKDTEDEDTSYEASEPGPEAQLQRELEQSEDAEHNLLLQLGLHLLNSFSCNSHTDSYE